MRDLLHQLEEHAREHPHSIAIQDHDGARFSYLDLWDAVLSFGKNLEYLAGHTLSLELEKSANFIVALCACWKKSITTVICDPAWPENRLDSIRKESNASARIVSGPLSEPPQLVSLSNGIKNEEGDIAYIIYSSGSSGKPKGVKVRDERFFQMIKEQIACFGLNANSHSLWFHGVGFDASLSDIFTALVAAARLCIFPTTGFSLAEFYQFLSNSKITHMDIPPSLLSELDMNKMPNTLESLIVGGEATAIPLVQRWTQNFRLINVYGPTEATVCTSMIAADSTWDTHYIGPPMQGLRYAIIDPETQAESNIGELWIYGKGIASGYLNQPRLSSTKFTTYQGQPCFKTGDRVKQSTQGRLEFMGRIDRQFKLNGCLVAPEEIETSINQLQGVQNSYIACEQGVIEAWIETSAYTMLEIQEALLHQLPHWMVPKRIHLAEKLNRNPNCKITSQNRSGRDPSLAAEICTWMQDAIPYPALELTDDFFLSGGDSLAVVRFLSIAEQEGFTLQPDCLERHPTALDLAESLPSNRYQAMSREELDLAVKQELRQIDSTATPATKDEPFAFLLTGATGFLGSAILGHLLASSDTPVVCLVRGHDLKNEEVRIQNQLKAHGFGSHHSFELCYADLTKNNLGLTFESWKKLCDSPWHIIHSAADTHMLRPYHSLAESNLKGTRRMLQLLNRGATKRLSYVSTLSVLLDQFPTPAICLESDSLENTSEVCGGYAQSKWAAERLIRLHPQSHKKSQIIRPGLLTPNRKTGHRPEGDLFTQYTSGKISTSSDRRSMDFSPVCITAQHIVQLLLQGDQGMTYHLANNDPLTGTTLQQAISANNTTSEKTLKQAAVNKDPVWYSLFKAHQTRFDCSNSIKILGDPLFPAPTMEQITT